MPPESKTSKMTSTGNKRSADKITGSDKTIKPPSKRQSLGKDVRDHNSNLLSPSTTSEPSVIDLVDDDRDGADLPERESTPEPVIVLKTFKKPEEGFPQHGDTYINLDIGTGISMQLQLHAKDLNRASPKLKEILKGHIDEPDLDMAQKSKRSNGIANRLVLIYDIDSKLHVLTRVSLTMKTKPKKASVSTRYSTRPADLSALGHVTRAASKPLPQYDGPMDSIDESFVDQRLAVKREEQVLENEIKVEQVESTTLDDSSTRNKAEITIVDVQSANRVEPVVKQEESESNAATHGAGNSPKTAEVDAETKKAAIKLEDVEDSALINNTIKNEEVADSARVYNTIKNEKVEDTAWTNNTKHAAINGKDTSDSPRPSLYTAGEVPETVKQFEPSAVVTIKQDEDEPWPSPPVMVNVERPNTSKDMAPTELTGDNEKTEVEPTEEKEAGLQNHSLIPVDAIIIEDDVHSSLKPDNEQINLDAEVPNAQKLLVNNEKPQVTEPEVLVPVSELKQQATSKSEEERTNNMTSFSQVQNTEGELARDSVRADHASPKIDKNEKTTFKQEDSQRRMISAPKDKNQLANDYFAAYKNLFLIYCSQTPVTPLNDISKLLRQAELLLRLSDYYKSTKIVSTQFRLYLSHAFNHYDRDMRLAISRNPPRWMNMAMQLESGPMFKEAAIHIIANFPSVNWGNSLIIMWSREVRGLIESKAEELKILKASIDASLIKNDIECDGEAVRICHHSNKLYHVSMVVNMWREWYLDGIGQNEEDGQANSKKKPLENAKMYRKLAGHPAQYLTLDVVCKTIQTWKGEEPLTKLEEDEIARSLHCLKQKARRLVAPLCVNNSMLPVEEYGIDYFTCIKIEDDELPWMNEGDD